MSTRPRTPAPGTPGARQAAAARARRSMKRDGQPIVMVTAYDSPSGQVADDAGVELVLVGDSAAMTVLGHASTVPATMDEMLMLTRAVDPRRPTHPLVVADLPFMSYQVRDRDAMRNAGRLHQGGRRRRRQAGGRRRRRSTGSAPLDARRHPGDGPPRPDAADGDRARRLQGPGPDGRRGAAAASTTRSRSRRQAPSRSCSSACRPRRPAGSRTRCDPDDRHRRRRRLRRPGARLPRPARALRRAARAAVREALRRPARRRARRRHGATRPRCARAPSRRRAHRTRCRRRSSPGSRTRCTGEPAVRLTVAEDRGSNTGQDLSPDRMT